MIRLNFSRSKFNAFILALLLTGCIGQSSIEPDLDNVVSFEVGHSQSFVSALLNENSEFPCIVPSSCPPNPISLATISVRTENVAGRVLKLTDIGFGPFFISEFPIDLTKGEEVTVQVLVNQTTYQATENMPDISDKILDFAYLTAEPNPGLFIRFNRANLSESEAVYLQLFANQNPVYGYIVFPDFKRSSEIANNGIFIPDTLEGGGQYYISKDELIKSNPRFLTQPGDAVKLVSRTLTKSSTEFFLAYRRAILNGEFSLNDGLFFAPPQNLPTNFNNGAFGMFHLYHEQELVRVVM